MALKDPSGPFLLFCFFLSGIACLVLEVLWVRLLTLSLGHTTVAVSSVLAIYMCGLALGSYWEGRRSDRPSWTECIGRYARLEILIGVLGLAATIVLTVTRSPYLTGIGMLFLLLPTFFMGMTFPLLSRGPLGVASLYGINTLGAVTGTVLAGFVLVPQIGILKSAVFSAALNFLCAGIAFAVSRMQTRSTESIGLPTLALQYSATVGRKNVWLAGVLVLAGMGAFVCEVAWTRAFAMVLGSSTYAFSIMLAVFLVGIGLGGLIYGKWLKSQAVFPLVFCHVALVLIAFSVLSYLSLFNTLPYRFVRLFAFAMQGPWFLHTVQFILCAAVMLLPTLLMGCTFPWLLELAGSKDIGFGVGFCYALATVGNIMGSLLAGLFLLPRWGAEHTLLIGAGCYMFAGLLGLAFSKIKASLKTGLTLTFATTFCSVVLLRAGWDPYVLTSGAFLYAPSYRNLKGYSEFLSDVHKNTLRFYKDGISSTVAVFDSPYGERFLRINGKTDASSGIDMSTQLLLGYLPPLLHKSQYKNAIVIGFGSGVSVAAVASFPSIKSVECVELEPAVIEAGPYFEALNRSVLSDPRLKIHSTDARRFLARTKTKYDLILSEPSNPWLAGVANLYTQEAFQLAKDRLNADGVFCQWFHGYSMSGADFRLIMKTFKSVFPNAILLTTGDKDFFLAGSVSDWNFDFPRMIQQFKDNPIMADDMRRLGMGHPFTMMATTFLMETEAYDAFVGADVPIHRDDRPTLEFSAPRYLQFSQDRQIWQDLMKCKTQMLPKALSGLKASKSEWALLHNMAGEAFLRTRNLDMAEVHINKALELDPQNARTWSNVGRIHNARNQHLQSERAFRKAIGINSNYALPWFHLGMLYLDEGVLDKALSSLENGMRISPSDPMGSLQLAQLYVRMEQPRKAEKLLLKAMEKPILNSDLNNAIMQLHNSLRR